MLPSQTGLPHVRVVANQDFQVEWVAAHDSDCYWVLTLAKNAAKNLLSTTSAVLDSYIDNAPAPQRVPLPTRYQKYHRKYNSTTLDNKVVGDKFFQSVIKWSDNNTNYIQRPDTFEGNFTGAPGNRGENVVPTAVVQAAYFQNSSCAVTDRRAQYTNPLYPWIIAVHRYRLCSNQAGRPDVARLTFPTGTAPGLYIAAWQWRGYYDAVDVEVVAGSTPVAKPYGDKVPPPVKGVPAQYKRIDHCAFPDALPTAGCYRIMTDAAGCMQSCDRQTEFQCTGVQVTPVLPRATVYPAFRNISYMPYGYVSNCRKNDVERGALPQHFACWPLQARPRTDTHDRYVISDDPDDPIFYSTCYMRISYKVAASSSTPPLPRALEWQFGRACLNCNDAAVATAEYAYPTWNVSNTCINCDIEGRTLAMLSTTERPVNCTALQPVWTPVTPTFAYCRGIAGGNISASPLYTCENGTTYCAHRLAPAGGFTQGDISLLDCQRMASADSRCSSLVLVNDEPTVNRRVCYCYRGTWRNSTGDAPCCGECVPYSNLSSWQQFTLT